MSRRIPLTRLDVSMTCRIEDSSTDGRPTADPCVESATADRPRILDRLTSPVGLLLIVAVAFAVGQFILFDEHRFLEWDEAVYVNEASNRFNGGVWSAHRALGVPWLLAPLFWITPSF